MSVLDVLRERKAKSLQHSIRASEANERHLHNKAMLTKELVYSKDGIDEDVLMGKQLASYYYLMKAEYDKSVLFSKPTNTEKGKAFWARVVERCREAGVDPQRYMKAQFQYFHKSFGTTPELHQVSTPAAVLRAKEFVGNTVGNVVGNGIKADIDIGHLFSRCEKQLREMCKAQKMTRKEFYLAFVVTNIVPFPKEFLLADPVYREVMNGED